MSRRHIILSLLILAGATCVVAQQPVTIVNQSLQTIQASACKARFSLTQRVARGEQPVQVDGTIVMKGEKFHIDSKDIKAWFDGKTQWVYMVDQGEVSITEPTAEEAADMNPILLVKEYIDNCRIIFSTTEQDQTHHVIEFYPKDKMSELLCLTLRIRKSDKIPTSVNIKTSKGGMTNLRLTNVQTHQQTTEASFKFDKSKFKDVYINDLR
ncbi:MAG: outer membrane lipoprotein carrier protein LolA [Paludibacteraceae bacterium]|nr:outer membrane lipoprotein carrier protein LolA [Paludibacteraceae bacterium]